MRLLQIDADDQITFAETCDKNPPAYAILSHTWGEEKHEVNYKDILKKKGRDKCGYEKLLFCGRQAIQDGLTHFWVDTCCIDSSSSAELSKAINCMFAWYRDAKKCYVYLADVLIDDRVQSDSLYPLSWKLAFRRSRWFTRGWTLQELLAPSDVEFFSRDSHWLGDKRSLHAIISEITHIPSQAILGGSLLDFSIDERISWSKNRKTKEAEDKVYSLLGIFGVYMSLIYGEGEENAFKRLKREIYPVPKYPIRKAQTATSPSTSRRIPRAGHNSFEDIRITGNAINITVSTTGGSVSERGIDLSENAVHIGGQHTEQSFLSSLEFSKQRHMEQVTNQDVQETRQTQQSQWQNRSGNEENECRSEQYYLAR